MGTPAILLLAGQRTDEASATRHVVTIDLLIEFKGGQHPVNKLILIAANGGVWMTLHLLTSDSRAGRPPLTRPLFRGLRHGVSAT